MITFSHLSCVRVTINESNRWAEINHNKKRSIKIISVRILSLITPFSLHSLLKGNWLTEYLLFWKYWIKSYQDSNSLPHSIIKGLKRVFHKYI